MNHEQDLKNNNSEKNSPDDGSQSVPNPEELLTGTIVENTTALLRLFNADGTSKYVNKAWTEFTGSQKSSAFTLTEHMHPDDTGKYNTAWQQATSQNAVFETSYLLLHRSGNYRWISEFTKPVYCSKGICNGYLSTGIDIHLHKEHEAHYIKKWSSVWRSAFHDLRGNIGIVSGASGLLQMMDKKEDRENTLEMINRNVRQIQHIMTQLLTQFEAEAD